MINSVSLVGRLTADPELRYTQNGVAVANFRLAVNRNFKNQDGEVEADFINCVTWRRQAENLANYMSKGSQVGITGRIQSRNYENKEGRRVFLTEVVAEQVAFLESKNSNQGQSSQSSNQGQSEQSGFHGGRQGDPIDISDDDLPF